MFCHHCGSQLPPAASACPACGTSLTPVPAAAPLADRLHLAGVLWMALSGLHLIPGVVLLIIAGGVTRILPPGVPAFVSVIIQGFGLMMLLVAALGMMAGWGLISRQNWGRTLAIVMAFLNLLEVPLGTALGAYTLWLLLPASAGAEYRRLSAAS